MFICFYVLAEHYTNYATCCVLIKAYKFYYLTHTPYVRCSLVLVNSIVPFDSKKEEEKNSMWCDFNGAFKTQWQIIYENFTQNESLRFRLLIITQFCLFYTIHTLLIALSPISSNGLSVCLSVCHEYFLSFNLSLMFHSC